VTLGVTGIWALAGAVVFGLILADIWTHPAGTTAAGSQIVSLEKNTGNQLIGKSA
jgi:hypothetical protein